MFQNVNDMLTDDVCFEQLGPEYHSPFQNGVYSETKLCYSGTKLCTLKTPIEKGSQNENGRTAIP